MSAQIGSLAGWYFLPGPLPGTPQFNSDKRKIQICVILLYLAYTVYDADYQLRQAGDFYQQLGVPVDVNDKGVLGRFRRLTVQYHPDKVSTAEHAHVEAVFIQLKIIRDTLIDPAKRFAYDRFGPEVLQWQSCKTIKDYVMTGIQQTSVYYVGTATALILTSMLGYMQSGKFWRYMVLAAMFVTEITIMTRPAYPTILSALINPVLTTSRIRQPLLPYQFLVLLRKIALTIFIAISQLQPLLRSPASARGDSDAASHQQLDRANAIATATDQELARLNGFELAQYGMDEASEQMLRATLKEWLVHNTIRNDTEVRTAMNNVLERRRALAETPS